MSFFGVNLLPDPEAVIPTEFYDVRAETTPKAGWVPMYSFTALIYIAALVAFVTLFQNEASKSTTETVILPYDNTGNDGYTCQMISRVTATYQIPAAGDPSLAYNLVNVMESKTNCETDLATASPTSILVSTGSTESASRRTRWIPSSRTSRLPFVTALCVTMAWLLAESAIGTTPMNGGKDADEAERQTQELRIEQHLYSWRYAHCRDEKVDPGSLSKEEDLEPEEIWARSEGNRQHLWFSHNRVLLHAGVLKNDINNGVGYRLINASVRPKDPIFKKQELYSCRCCDRVMNFLKLS